MLSSGGSVDIIVPAGSASICNSVELEMTIFNNTGAAVTLSPAHLLIQYIELSGQSGKQLIQRLDGFGNVYLGQSFIPNEAEILEVGSLLLRMVGLAGSQALLELRNHILGPADLLSKLGQLGSSCCISASEAIR